MYVSYAGYRGTFPLCFFGFALLAGQVILKIKACWARSLQIYAVWILGGGKNSVVLVLSSNRIWRYDRYKKDAEGVIE